MWRLSKRLYNRIDNRLYRVNGVCQCVVGLRQSASQHAFPRSVLESRCSTTKMIMPLSNFKNSLSSLSSTTISLGMRSSLQDRGVNNATAASHSSSTLLPKCWLWQQDCAASDCSRNTDLRLRQDVMDGNIVTPGPFVRYIDQSSRVIHINSVTIVWLRWFDDCFDFCGRFLNKPPVPPKNPGVFSRWQNPKWPSTSS